LKTHFSPIDFPIILAAIYLPVTWRPSISGARRQRQKHQRSGLSVQFFILWLNIFPNFLTKTLLYLSWSFKNVLISYCFLYISRLFRYYFLKVFLILLHLRNFTACHVCYLETATLQEFISGQYGDLHMLMFQSWLVYFIVNSYKKSWFLIG
jgi:hypothetical protein